MKYFQLLKIKVILTLTCKQCNQTITTIDYSMEVYLLIKFAGEMPSLPRCLTLDITD